MKKLLLIGLSLVLFAGLSYAQPDRQAFKEKLNSMRIAFITQKLDLTPQEAKGFWPIYDAYTKERQALHKNSGRQAKSADALSPEEAEAMLAGSLENDQKQVALRKKYYDQLREVIPAAKIVKLTQAEREFKKEILKAAKEKRRQAARPNR